MSAKRVSFLLEVGKSEVFLSLKRGTLIMERVLVCDGYSLLERMLPTIENMLQKYHLKTGDIEKFEVISNLPEGYSARRIAETIASVYDFAIV